MLIKQLFDHDTWTYTYLLADAESGDAIIIDPVIEKIDRDLQLIEELGLRLRYTLDTHVHADHVTGSGQLRERTGAQSGVAAVAGVPCVDRALRHGDDLTFGRHTLHVRSTPGHTDGCLTFVVEDQGQTYAFTGDALFIRGCGRTDFQAGDSATLFRSVHDQIYSLPEDTVIYPGHDYRGHRSSTVAEEKAHNPRLNTTIDEQRFVQIMGDLKLSHPKRIHEALPANMSCGISIQASTPAVHVKEIEPADLASLTGALLVDVRSPEEYAGDLGHLEGSVLAPLPVLEQHAKNWSSEQPIVVVCRSGQRSAKACEILTSLGFSDVTNLAGGMIACRAQREVPSC